MDALVGLQKCVVKQIVSTVRYECILPACSGRKLPVQITQTIDNSLSSVLPFSMFLDVLILGTLLLIALVIPALQ